MSNINAADDNKRGMVAPLSGVRVVELGSYVAGPFCSRILADFGADVIKVEAPNEGDPLRQWGRGSVDDGHYLWWPVQSRNKRCITLNLRDAAGQQLARRLLGFADVAVENFRPGTLEEWGLAPEALGEINPNLIVIRISGYGQTGPYRNRASFGSIAEAFGGLRYITGSPDRPPSRIGIAIGDSLGSLFGVIGALLALYARERGRTHGQTVDVALYEAVFAVTESLVTEYDRLGIVRERTGNIMPGVAPSNVYTTKDGRALVIAANADGVFRRLAHAMGMPSLTEDDRFRDHVARGRHMNDLDQLISQWAGSHSREELLDVLNAQSVPASAIYTAKDIVRDEHYVARDMLLNVTCPDRGPLKMPGIVPKLSTTPGSVTWSGPRLGEHNKEVYCGLLGLTVEELETLQSEGVV